MYSTISPPRVLYCTGIDRDAEIRKHKPDLPITICTEATDMWQELAPLLDRTPASFACGCGPMTVPGLRQLAADTNPWSTPKPVSTWAVA